MAAVVKVRKEVKVRVLLLLLLLRNRLKNMSGVRRVESGFLFNQKKELEFHDVPKVTPH
jgi:hypothetical protein